MYVCMWPMPPFVDKRDAWVAMDDAHDPVYSQFWEDIGMFRLCSNELNSSDLPCR